MSHIQLNEDLKSKIAAEPQPANESIIEKISSIQNEHGEKQVIIDDGDEDLMMALNDEDWMLSQQW